MPKNPGSKRLPNNEQTISIDPNPDQNLRDYRATRKHDEKGFTIYEAKRISSNQDVILYKYKDDEHGKKARNEVDLTSKISHKNIIRYVQSFDYSGKFYTSIEPINGGNLLDVIEESRAQARPFTEAHAREIFRQVLNALAFLDKNKIAHRNVTPACIVFPRVDQHTIKIANFVDAVKIGDNELRTDPVGKPLVMSPEMIRAALDGPGHGRGYGRKTDIWSFGCVVYYIFTGGLPFKENRKRNKADYQEALDEIRTKEEDRFKDTYWKHISPEGKDFTKRLLTSDMTKRPSPAEALHHEYMIGQKPPDEDLCLYHKGENENLVLGFWKDFRIWRSNTKSRKRETKEEADKRREIRKGKEPAGR